MCKNREKGMCSDPCNFDSSLLMSLGSTAERLGVALRYEQSNFTVSRLRHVVCAET